MEINPEKSISNSLKQLDSSSINKNQLNTSSSKMQYSFPKTERFGETQQYVFIKLAHFLLLNSMISQQQNPRELHQLATETRLISPKETLLHQNQEDIHYKHNLRTTENMVKLWEKEEILLKPMICFTEA
jgi:hypothetical protein